MKPLIIEDKTKDIIRIKERKRIGFLNIDENNCLDCFLVGSGLNKKEQNNRINNMTGKIIPYSVDKMFMLSLKSKATKNETSIGDKMIILVKIK